MTQLLVTGRNQALRDRLADFLTNEGYLVTVATDDEGVLRRAREQAPDVILLNLSGDYACTDQLCQCIRADGPTPSLWMSAERTGEVSRAGSGSEPATAGERPLLREVLRHSEAYPRLLRSGDLVLDLLARRALRDGQMLSLTPKEFHLLVEFVRHRGMLLSRAQLFELVWGGQYAGDRRTLDVHISWLRKKIERSPERPQRITTVRNLGYRFEN